MSEQDKQKRGVAIILVVGLMGMLMLAAAAFSISMRIERQGAANYRYGVQARHMLWSALAASIEDINEMQDGGGGFKIYPEWEVIGSLQYDTNNSLHAFSTPASVVSLNSLAHIPMYLRGVAETNVAPYWNLLADAGGEIRGRYAYIVVNTSGLLDANVSGGAPRWMGTNACELAIADPADAAFSIRDNTHRRYESLAELEVLNPALFGMGDDLGIYNLSFEDQTLESPVQVEDRVYVGGSETDLQAERDAITNAFARSGVADPEQAYLNLIDYVDADSVPSDLGSSATEQVPMVNEVAIPFFSIAIDALSNFTANVGFSMECAYPFPDASTEAFTCVARVTAEDPAGNNQIGSAVILPALTVSNVFSAGMIAAGQYPQVGILTNYSGKVTGAGNLRFDVYVSAQVYNGTGDLVDVVPSSPTAKGPRMVINIPGVSIPGTYNTMDWAECIDPRFNWDPNGVGGQAQWQVGSFLKLFPPGAGMGPSLGAPNKYALQLLNPTVPPFTVTPSLQHDLDGDMQMFVKNAPLAVVGELGFLAYDQWKTIRLYDHNSPYTEVVAGKTVPYHKVLDYFTLHDTNAIHRGLVNVNTMRPEVLATAFMGAPAGPTTNATPALAWADAMDVAADIVAAGPYTNLASIGKAVEFRSKGYVGSSELEREAPYRNTAGLLTVRNNHFTILLRSEAYTLGIGGQQAKSGKTLASAHALAEVWRDPFPMIDPATGNPYMDQGQRVHRCFIRSFRILEE